MIVTYTDQFEGCQDQHESLCAPLYTGYSYSFIILTAAVSGKAKFVNATVNHARELLMAVYIYAKLVGRVTSTRS